MSWEQLKCDAEFLSANLGELQERDQGFASSLLEQFHERGLSAKQEYWVGVLADRARERIAAKQRAAAAAPAPKRVDLSRIVDLLTKAREHKDHPFILVDAGLDCGELRLNIAGSASKYAGQINIATRGSYEDRVWLGRVDHEGRYWPSRDAERGGEAPHVQAALEALAKDPAGVASAFGRRTGSCCFCARALTDARSVSVGYGPICADNFGLPWGEVIEEAVVEQLPLPRPPAIDYADAVGDGYDRLGPVTDRKVSELQELRDRKPAARGSNGGVPFNDEIPF